MALLANPEHALLSAIVERGILEGLSFTVSPDTLPTAMQHHAAALQSYPEAIRSHDVVPSADWSIGLEGRSSPTSNMLVRRRMNIVFGAENPSPAVEDVNVQIHGMLPPVAGSEDAAMFQAWIDHDGRNPPAEVENEHRYWCDRSDIVYAIVELLKGDPGEQVFNLAGRRKWTLLETCHEFYELAHRTKAGQTGRFDISHLEAKGVPSLKAVSVKSAPSGKPRPSLESIHRFLEKQDGEGWRPKTPLRQSLMFVMAMLEANHAS